MFAARSGAIFIAVKYLERNAWTTLPSAPGAIESTSLNSARYLSSCMHALQTCCAIASICAMTVLDGLNGEWMPPCVSVSSFLLLDTFVNTHLATLALSCALARIGIMTSVKRELPVTSWNRRLKSPSSKESGTTTLSQVASAILVSTHAARWSVSTITASKSAGSDATAARSRCAAGHHSSPLRVHSGECPLSSA